MEAPPPLMRIHPMRAGRARGTWPAPLGLAASRLFLRHVTAHTSRATSYSNHGQRLYQAVPRLRVFSRCHAHPHGPARVGPHPGIVRTVLNSPCTPAYSPARVPPHLPGACHRDMPSRDPRRPRALHALHLCLAQTPLQRCARLSVVWERGAITHHTVCTVSARL